LNIQGSNFERAVLALSLFFGVLGFFWSFSGMASSNPKSSKPSRKDRYNRYTPEQLEEAIARIRSGELKLREASRNYPISLGTLSNHLHGKHVQPIGHPKIPKRAPKSDWFCDKCLPADFDEDEPYYCENCD
jgi:hypothetical protein